MCLTGYMYRSSSEIASVLEDPRTGPTATLSSELARRCACWVVAGYPEKSWVRGMDVGEAEDEEDDDGEVSGEEEGGERAGETTGSTADREEEEQVIAYNSAVIVSPQGTVYDTYRKSFLFDTDKTWAKEGESTISFSPLGSPGTAREF
jgi:protein N-terminal amidase